MKKIFYVLAICAVSLMVSCKGSDSKKDAAGSESEKKTEEVAPAEKATETEATAEEGESVLEAQDEASLELLGAYNAVADELDNVKSKEDLSALCQGLAETMKELSGKYPDFEPDEDVQKASVAVGMAISGAGAELGLSQDEINELLQPLNEVE